MAKGYIYIMTNRSLHGMVKIGYSTNVEKRRKQLSTTALLWEYEVYATYETPGNLEDKKLHMLLDKLNPSLRVNQHKEFYSMRPEDAYDVLEAIAIISGTQDKLVQIGSPDTAGKDNKANPGKSQPITLQEYLENKNPVLVKWYKELQAQTYAQLPGVEMYVLPQYIGWRINGKYFAEFHIQKSKLLVHTARPNQKFKIGENVPDRFGWSLNYRAYVEEVNDITEAIEIIKQSYYTKRDNIKPNDNEGGKKGEPSVTTKCKPMVKALTFAMLSIPVGTCLVYTRDPSVVVTTVDEKNQVNYNGQVVSISRAACMLLNKATAQGGECFLWKGKKLTEWRKEIEAQAQDK
jgi:hypothetical protein